jgi:hypothetical protein
MRTLSTIGLMASALFAAGLVGGCGKDSQPPEYSETPEGRVTAIDKSTGIVSMTYFSEKHQREVPLSGRLAPAAEIFINGKTARLEDVRVGDRVRVTGRVEKSEGERQLVATKIEITRREGDRSTKPAPATPAAG